MAKKYEGTREEQVTARLDNLTHGEETPTKLLTRETRILKGVSADERISDILSKEDYLPRRDGSWKVVSDMWKNASDDERRDYLCSMVLYDGIVLHSKIGLRTVADFFCISVDELKPYTDVARYADAARVLRIRRYQLERTKAGAEKDITALWNLTKQFAYQVTDPAHDDVASVTTTPPAIIINSAKADNKELKEELEKKLKDAGVNVDFSKLN